MFWILLIFGVLKQFSSERACCLLLSLELLPIAVHVVVCVMSRWSYSRRPIV